MSDLDDMLVFATVVEQGSFTSAADVLATPKSNISRRVTRLEQRLGVRLLERSTRSQSLTEVGQRYYDYCQRIKEEMLAAENAVASMLAKPRGRLRVCTSIGIGQSLLASHLGQFCRQYSDIELDLSLTSRRVDVIEEGYDLVIRVGELPDSGLIARKLCQIRLSLYAAADYQNRKIHAPEDLLDYPLLLMSAKERKPVWTLISGKKTQQLTFTPAIRCDDFTMLKRLCSEGAGITGLPDYMAREMLDSGRLVRVLDEWSFQPVDLYAIYPSHRGAMPKVRALVDHLVEVLAP